KPTGCQTCGYKIYECKSCSTRFPAFLGRCPTCATLCQESIAPETLPKLRKAFPSVFGVGPISTHDIDLDASALSQRTPPPVKQHKQEQDPRYSTRVDKPAKKLDVPLPKEPDKK